MRGPIMAILVILMMMSPAALSLAQPQPEADRYNIARPVEVLEAWEQVTDEDGDGLWNDIQVIVKANFTREGDYTVVYKLLPQDDGWWLSSSESISPKAPATGQKTFTAYLGVSFEGWKLRSKHVDGELVFRVEVMDAKATTVLAKHERVIGPYKWTQFEATNAGARIMGLGDVKRLDFDGDGKYEVAEVPIKIEADGAGLYRIITIYSWTPALAGSLTGDATRLRYTTLTNESQLERGLNEVPVWISGGHIRTSTYINLTITVYKGAFWGDTERYSLQVVDGRAYELPTLWGIYAGAHGEDAVDTDRDGVDDHLRVRAVIDVDIPGHYTFTALLTPHGTISETDAATNYDLLNRLIEVKTAAKVTWEWDYGVGRSQAMWYFDGRLINSWAHDGTFDVHVYAWGPAPYLYTRFHFETASFRADDFVHPEPPLEFMPPHRDEGVDKENKEGMEEGKGTYDHLRLTFNVDVNIASTFTAFAVLYYEGKEIAYARREVQLDRGPGHLQMDFPGPAIHNARVEGVMTAMVWVQGAGFSWNDTTLQAPMTTRHLTSKYSWEMFEPPKVKFDRKDPQPVEDLDYLILRTGIMAVRIDRNNPDLLFYMTEDDGRTAMFRVVYTRLLAFTDSNADGAPQAKEVGYTSALWSYDWGMSGVTLSEEETSGRMATFSMSTVVDLVEHDPAAADEGRPLANVPEFARVTLTFSLSSRDLNHTDETGTYQVMGGAELKVDIQIDVLTPIEGIDFLTVEQVLKDDRHRFTPRPEDGQDVPEDEVARHKDAEELKQSVRFSHGEDAPGFYSWVKKAVVGNVDGTEEVVDVHAGYIASDGQMLLYLSYPYDVDTAYVFHDPSLGIFEGGFPGLPEGWEAIFDPMLWGLAALAAVGVVYGMRGRRGRPMEDEDLEWDDEYVEPEEPGTPPPAGGSHEPASPREHAGEEHPPQPPDDIPALPDEPVETNGSTILMYPPPEEGVEGEARRPDGWDVLDD